jgi:hypothetical protein
MGHHRFQVGQRVSIAGDHRAMAYGSGYTVSRLLPAMTTEPRYRIKRTTETYERVAEEHELRRVDIEPVLDSAVPPPNAAARLDPWRASVR